jgi:Na+-transporting NADH:ubiquinone oxidoreductase subunit F
MSGPYGEFFPKHTDAEMIYVGGGSGMAPMRSHIFHLLKEVGTGRKISYWYGARSLREMFYIEDFDQLQEQYDNFEWNVALSQPQPEDDWQGYSGYVNHLLYENYLKEHPNPEACEYYLCGPPPMLIALIEILHNLGVEDENIMFDDFCP